MKKFCAIMLTVLMLILPLSTGAYASSSDLSLDISPENETYDISQNLYGAFIEDISYACDGGLVSNLVNNNSFEYESDKDANWIFIGAEYQIENSDSLNKNNPSYAKVKVNGSVTLTNIGYPEYYEYKTYTVDKVKATTPDMGFKANEKYAFSCYIKNIDYSGSFKVYLDSASNAADKREIDISSLNEWTKVSCELTSTATEDGGLSFLCNGSGTFLMDFVQLIPESSHGYGTDEWKYVTLREDLYSALEALHPAFIRFPGGCLCEGTELSNLYDWKSTIGAVEEREQDFNLWRDDNNGRQYINTNSMGYNEYFSLCADLGAEPLPILNVGLTCQGRNGYGAQRDKYKKGELTEEQWQSYLSAVALTPGTAEWQSYVQDILDLIEYANGDITTKWGEIRAENGHPEPYNLKYIGLGNENWGDVYFRNFDALYKAVKAAYPEITVISSSGTWLDGDDYTQAWQTINEKYTDTIVDEHYYTRDGYLFSHNDRYDSFSRNGAGVFVGEYAATSAGVGTLETKSNIWEAVEEASYLTGIERNGDIVKMASYAPTFAKVNSQCWDINMIWFDSQQTVLTPSYYVQMLFSNNTGSKYMKTAFSNGKTYTDDKVYESVTVDENTQTLYVKLVNAGG